ncbi:hypothetical protein FA15DRAFT_664612 [Coprinopsis marcescibilis]|uniref:F-box domain-containing protein n=1 Tax=Coprinopsis marcescibilis TaxID=230819 RepID=A0A5C3L8E6_COPMA|nr:hypothetical protein FA15DRAFT_664612 [Coprinopsis marcescibilis]
MKENGTSSGIKAGAIAIQDGALHKPKVQDEAGELDRRIAYHEIELLALRQRKNAMNKACNIPAELLCQIFSDCLDMSSASNRSRDVLRTWKSVTQVSHRWRVIAINYPQLWSEISFDTAFWAQTSLERSRNMPIYLTTEENMPPETEQVLKVALSQPRRIKALSMTDTCDILEGRLRKLSNAPILECLQLYNTDIPPGSAQRFPIFEGNAPRLQQLFLRNTAFPWPSSILGGLTDFQFASVHPSISAADFLDALQAMPNLEILELVVMRYPDFDSLNNLRPAVPLPKFQHLRMILAPMDACSGFLKHVTLPTTASIEIQCPNTHVDEATLSELSSSLTSSWLADPLSDSSARKPRTLQSMRVTQLEEDVMQCDVELNAWLEVLEPWVDDAEPLPAITFRTREWSFWAPSHLVLPLSNMRSLDLQIALHPELCLEVLALCPLMEHLGLGPHSILGVIEFLGRDPGFMPRSDIDLEEHETRPTRFPNLKSISFYETYIYPDDSIGRNADLDLRGLCGLLGIRKQLGSTLALIGLYDCDHLTVHDLIALHDVVSDVQIYDDLSQEEEDVSQSPNESPELEQTIP